MPERLCRFVPSEWPGGCPHEALEAWAGACADWLAADSARSGGRWFAAGGSRRRLPFGEFGDAVDVLREWGRYGEAMPPCPHEFRPATYQGPANC